MSAISGTTQVQEQDVRIPELSDRSDHAIIPHRGTCAGTPELMRKGIMKEESRFMADASSHSSLLRGDVQSQLPRERQATRRVTHSLCTIDIGDQVWHRFWEN